jgi:predicted transcriptional regulator
MSISVTAGENTEGARSAPEFSFLTNHAKALLLIAHDPRIRIRDIARLLDITERRTQQIVADLAEAGYIERERDGRERDGRRNLYTVSTHLPLGLPTQRDTDIGALLAILPTPSGSP